MLSFLSHSSVSKPVPLPVNCMMPCLTDMYGNAAFAMMQVTPNPAYTDKLTQPMASDTSSISVPCTKCGCDRDPSPETAALTAAPVATGQKSYQGMTWRSWIAPVFLAAGVCVHAVLEGLALGLQRDKAGAVTVLVAMVSHKWVESVALSSITVKNGGGFK